MEHSVDDYIVMIKDILESEDGVIFGYLFGSIGNEGFTDQSDIDCALYLGDLSFEYRLQLHHRLEKRLHRNIDMVVLNEISNIDLLREILDHGMSVKSGGEEEKIFSINGRLRIHDFQSFRSYVYGS